jgi:hypothetical protein
MEGKMKLTKKDLIHLYIGFALLFLGILTFYFTFEYSLGILFILVGSFLSLIGVLYTCWFGMIKGITIK